jgi:hypothetical protein
MVEWKGKLQILLCILPSGRGPIHLDINVCLNFFQHDEYATNENENKSFLLSAV